MAKLTERQKKNIVSAYAAGGISQKADNGIKGRIFFIENFIKEKETTPA